MNGDTIEDIIEEVQERQLEEDREDSKYGSYVEAEDDE
jgi:hypothetical protein